MRLIDADVLKNTLQSLAYNDWNQGAETTLATAYAKAAYIVEAQQTIDAEPVRHGRWIPHITEDGYRAGHDCSVCGAWLVMPDGLNKYCSDCGAKMDGGENDETD